MIPEPYLDAPVANVEGTPSVAALAGVSPAQDVIDLVSSSPSVSGTSSASGGAVEVHMAPLGEDPPRIASAVPTGDQLAAIDRALSSISANRLWAVQVSADTASNHRPLLGDIEEELRVLSRLTPWGLHVLFDPLDEREVALHDALASALENAFQFVNESRLRVNLSSPMLEELLSGLSILTASARSHFSDQRRAAVLRNSAARFRIQENQSGPDVVPSHAMVSQLLDDSEEYEGAVPESYRFYLEEDVSDDDDVME